MTETVKRAVAKDLSTLSVEERAHITAFVNSAAAQNYTTPAYESQQVARDPVLLARALAFPLPVEGMAVAAAEPMAVADASPLTPGPSPRRTRARGDAESPR